MDKGQSLLLRDPERDCTRLPFSINRGLSKNHSIIACRRYERRLLSRRKWCHSSNKTHSRAFIIFPGSEERASPFRDFHLSIFQGNLFTIFGPIRIMQAWRNSSWCNNKYQLNVGRRRVSSSRRQSGFVTYSIRNRGFCSPSHSCIYHPCDCINTFERCFICSEFPFDTR